MNAALSAQNFKATLSGLLIIILSSFSTLSKGQPLPEFTAQFDIWVMGFNIGEAQHKMTCEHQSCLLTSIAEPPGWVKRFINESAVEKIQIHQSDNDFKWLSYKKFLTRRKSGDTINKTETLIRNPTDNRIKYIEASSSWPNQEHVYDVISIAYGIQFLVSNKKPLEEIYLQDTKGQQKIQFSTLAKPETLDLPFNYRAKTLRYHFYNDKIDAKLWLMPSLNNFPVKMIVFNKDTDRKIELELNQKPRKP